MAVSTMYIVCRIPQIDGGTRFVGLCDRRAAVAARRAIREDRTMIDAIRPDEIRDLPRGRKPAGWVDL